ncbi:hypothetical protein BDA99DRAFT_496859 [Phascolomyces articulosus]|uniref:Uncharacterized protein n=1 Tax=Phascolomyces articulosus TaxID=60185 RepID=A0AAD5PKW9_9FUNG|nr:hypothetical protein BDA99DRAFT_496859 [Phascolomyces articulosus]
MGDNEQPPMQDKNATLQALGNVAEGMQSTFTSIYASFEKNLQMAQSATGLFEQALKNNIDIETQLEPKEQEGIQLVVTITNHVKIPLPGVQCSITFQSDQVHWSHLSTTQQPLSSTTSTTHLFSIFDTESLEDGSMELPPLSKHIEVLNIKTDRPIQCNATIVLHFPGPMPESTVPIEHVFGIYLVDQLSRTLLSEPYQGKSVCERSCSMDTLGLLLQVPPTQTIKPGLSTLLKSNTMDGFKMEIICRIEELDQETRMVKISFCTAESNELLSLLIHELDMLHW